MATNYGSNATKLLNQTIKQIVGPGEVAGRKRVIYDEFALSADLSASDKIYMGALIPAGARVHNVYLVFPDLDSGSTGSLDVGWLASADAVEAASSTGFFSAVDVHTAAGGVDLFDDAPTASGLFKQFSAAVQCVINVQGDTNATSGTIKLAIEYVTD